MTRGTHTLLGAAAAVPVALTLPLGPALGCVWWGVVGGRLPDWLDLRSDARRVLRHRGVSHSYAAIIVTSLLLYGLLRVLSRSEVLPLPTELAAPWAVALGLGMLSHLFGDACTVAGVRPGLPFSRRRLWLLPRLLRTRSDGFVDLLGRLVALTLLVAGTVAYALRGL